MKVLLARTQHVADAHDMKLWTVASYETDCGPITQKLAAQLASEQSACQILQQMVLNVPGHAAALRKRLSTLSADHQLRAEDSYIILNTTKRRGTAVHAIHVLPGKDERWAAAAVALVPGLESALGGQPKVSQCRSCVAVPPCFAL